MVRVNCQNGDGGGSWVGETLKHCKIQSRKDAPKMTILEAPRAQNAPGGSTMRLPEALLPRNPPWESSHFWGLTASAERSWHEIFLSSHEVSQRKMLQNFPRRF